MRKPHKQNATMSAAPLIAAFAALIWFLFACSSTDGKRPPARLKSDTSRMSQDFRKFQIIGEGANFLTIQCELPQPQSPKYRVHALILDEDGYPLDKVTGYTYRAGSQRTNRLWFYFFLYDPRQTLPFSRQSSYVRFVAGKEYTVELETVVKLNKTWGETGGPRIFDLPAPPDEISGFLVVKDYTFLARGDLRRPQGCYVEGKAVGHGGQWSHFVPLSSLRCENEQPAPELLFPVDQGWLELTTGRTHSMKEAVSPQEPYIEGWWDGKGYFHPRPARIHGLKEVPTK